MLEVMVIVSNLELLTGDCFYIIKDIIQRLFQSEVILGMLIQFVFLMRDDNVLFVHIFKGHLCC